jgi:uncharacterized membrane protein YsdA (DUF1294 family)/cold shock CspA family protein
MSNTTKTSTRKAPRYQGRITGWKDEQGFGFIAPNGGGPAVFVHISAFTDRGIRPANDDIVTYDLGANEKGPRAERVAFVVGRTPKEASFDKRKSALLVAAGFLCTIAVCVFMKKLPLAVFGLYLVASAVAFVAYAVDKSAARRNQRRTRERTLHLLGLVGGWPGALVAQQVLRHKSSKASFRSTFWITVLVNCGVLVWLLTPEGAAMLRGVFAVG